MNRKRNRLTFAVLNNTPLLLFAVVFIVFGLVAPQSLRYQSLENTFKQARGYTKEQFGRTHPGGAVGRKLTKNRHL